jgi:hypothetical protein
MLKRQWTSRFQKRYNKFWTNIQKVISDLNDNTAHDVICPQAEELFLVLSELRRIGEQMGRSESIIEIVKSAPSGYFTHRAQLHRGFYGTEFGYACWYIQACLGLALGSLINGDILESVVTDFDVKGFKVFPRRFPLEYLGSGPAPRSESPSSSNLSAYVKSQASSANSGSTGPRNSPAPFSVTIGVRSSNGSASSRTIELPGPSYLPTFSTSSEIAKSRQAADSNIAASLAGMPSILKSGILGKSPRKAGYPRVRVISPEGSAGNPTRTRRRRRPTLILKGEIFLRKDHDQANPHLIPHPCPHFLLLPHMKVLRASTSSHLQD